MITDIHFISSYVCLKNFLTVIDTSHRNIIFCTDNKDIVILLNDIFKEVDCDIIPLKIFNLYSINVLFVNRYVRKIFNSYIKNIEQFGRTYFYCDEFHYHFFFIINTLEKQSEIVFINSEPELTYTKVTGVKNKIKYYGTFILKLLLPVNLTFVNRGDQTYKWLHNHPSRKINAITREKIFDKFGYRLLTPQNKNQKTLLYLQQDLSAYPYIDYEKTKVKLVRVLKHFRENGYNLFIKLHPNSKENINYLQDLFDSESYVSSYIPAEFIGDVFNVYVTFHSLGIKPFLDRKSYSLLHMIEFISEEGENTICQFVYDNLKGIRFLSFDRHMLKVDL